MSTSQRSRPSASSTRCSSHESHAGSKECVADQIVAVGHASLRPHPRPGNIRRGRCGTLSCEQLTRNVPDSNPAVAASNRAALVASSCRAIRWRGRRDSTGHQQWHRHGTRRASASRRTLTRPSGRMETTSWRRPSRQIVPASGSELSCTVTPSAQPESSVQCPESAAGVATRACSTITTPIPAWLPTAQAWGPGVGAGHDEGHVVAHHVVRTDRSLLRGPNRTAGASTRSRGDQVRQPPRTRAIMRHS